MGVIYVSEEIRPVSVCEWVSEWVYVTMQKKVAMKRSLRIKITPQFLELRMRNFHEYYFLSTWVSREIFKSAIVWLSKYSLLKSTVYLKSILTLLKTFHYRYLTHSFPMHSFCNTWKDQKTVRLSVFRGQRKSALGMNGLMGLWICLFNLIFLFSYFRVIKFSRCYNLTTNFNYFKRSVKALNLVLSVIQFLQPMIFLSL